MEPKTIAQYEILDQIGRGGMGTVYRAQQPSLNRIIALKILPPALEQDPELLKRFKQEALAIAALDHPNIVHVYDTGQDHGVNYIAMEYINGGSLLAHMKRGVGPLPSTEAAGIACQIALALDYAHRRGIVHRDVKPSNILLDSEGRAVLADLGIARALEGTRLTHTGIAMGTPEYMSPEQAEGKPVDGRSDQYELGVVLFEMLSGRIPFRADTPLALLYKQIHEPPPDLQKLNPAVPRKLAAVVNRALAKDPANRFPSCRQMAAALQAAIPKLRLAMPVPAAAGAARRMQVPAGESLTAVKDAGTWAARKVGRFSLRLVQATLEVVLGAIAVLAVIGAILIVAVAFVLARYAENTLRDYPWEFTQVTPPSTYALGFDGFAEIVAPYLEQRTFGTVSQAHLNLQPPNRIALSANVLGNPLSLDGVVFEQNGIPQVRLEQVNRLPLWFAGDVISNGVNQGFLAGWSKAPVRVVRFTVSETELRMETENK